RAARHRARKYRAETHTAVAATEPYPQGKLLYPCEAGEGSQQTRSRSRESRQKSRDQTARIEQTRPDPLGLVAHFEISPALRSLRQCPCASASLTTHPDRCERCPRRCLSRREITIMATGLFRLGLIEMQTHSPSSPCVATIQGNYCVSGM